MRALAGARAPPAGAHRQRACGGRSSCTAAARPPAALPRPRPRRARGGPPRRASGGAEASSGEACILTATSAPPEPGGAAWGSPAPLAAARVADGSNNIIPVGTATCKALQSADGGGGAAAEARAAAAGGQQAAHTDGPAHAVAAAAAAPAEPGGQHRVAWLPEKHLWLPRNGHGGGGGGGGMPTNGSGSGSGSRSIASLSSSRGSSSSSNVPALSRVFMAAAATRGLKKAMEDRHVLAALDPARGVTASVGGVGLQHQVSVAAVFDGHAGHATAAYAARHIPHLLHEALSGQPAHVEGAPRVPVRGLLPPELALEASFRCFDRWWSDARCDPELTEHGWDDSGSTAVVGMVSGRDLVVANAGDSIALLSRGGSPCRLSVEHRVANAEEAERVLGAGGRLVALRPGAAPRVVGTSAHTCYKGSMVTRALGDFSFKHPQALISPDPHVAQVRLEPGDELVVLASDGVTDALGDDDVLGAAARAVEQARERTDSGQALAKAAAVAVMSEALRGGSTDNITACVLLLDWGGQYAFRHD